MKKVIGLLGILLLAGGLGWAQDTKSLRLGDLARQVRAARAQRNLSQVPYFTNDTLPRDTGGISVLGASRAAVSAEGEKGAAGAAAAGSEKPDCDEACWRGKFREKREQIATAQRELDILQREFNLARTQYYQDPNQAVLVWLIHGESRMSRFFHPYTGEDLGHSQTLGYRAVSWIIDLHDNLLYERKGRVANGIGAIFATLLALTGAVIWWPGLKKWPRSLILDWKARGALFHWSLHSMLGFWFFAFVLLWGVSGIYLAFPTPFDAFVERLDPIEEASTVPRLGDTALYWLTRLHFGRWGGLLTKTLWTLFGLVPAALFITGTYMWWCRSLRPSLDSRKEPAGAASASSVPVESKTPLTGTPA